MKRLLQFFEYFSFATTAAAQPQLQLMLNRADCLPKKNTKTRLSKLPEKAGEEGKRLNQLCTIKSALSRQ